MTFYQKNRSPEATNSGATSRQKRRHFPRWMSALSGRAMIVVLAVFMGLAAVAPAADAVPNDPFAELSASERACQRLGGQPQLNDDFKSVTCVTRYGVYHCTPNGCVPIYSHVPGDIRF